MLELLGSVEPNGWICGGICGLGCGAACTVGCTGAGAADGMLPVLDSFSWKLAVVGGGGGLGTVHGWVRNY
ncbi:hypothetical protein [uncultured Actinomyces sp.]|uniref:hypothetical protein n=1 Tax=uncultured Actinomyces sp. TaxID=249061 RepID=UPI002622AA93|nr:hypothetical protein [uncultured Actinomyces sp.]